MNSFICQVLFLCYEHWAGHGFECGITLGGLVIFLSRAAVTTEVSSSKFLASSLVLVKQTHIPYSIFMVISQQ